MSRSFSLSECVGRTPFEDGIALVFAAIEAEYHPERHEVEVTRKAYVTPTEMKHIAEHLDAPWLPEGGVVRAGCDAYESSDVARDIFHSWARRVKEAIPG